MIGADVGGTFTDIFILDEVEGTARIAKVPTTKPDQSAGFLAGLGFQVDDLSTVKVVVHGTTVGTNALLERKGAKIGVITTRGLRDVLEMRRRDRPRTWGLRGEFDPIVPRNLRIEVSERTLADGTVWTPVDVNEVSAAAKGLLEAECLAVAILFANSYANQENEQKAAAVVREFWPNPHVSTSAEILPEIREFERFSTTALNGYLQPEVAGYIDRLNTALKRDGFRGEFMIIQSNGGVMRTDTACQRPVRTALSGPAAGVIAAGFIAQTAGYENVITGDMGGTSFDVAIIANGQSMLAPQTAIDFGMVIRSPMIEITTIGAGGGSIAWVDRGGLLNIGPESAGSMPGPVAYGQGNTRPTVTDANIVLGRIDADSPIGGTLQRLDVEAAARAINEHVGSKLSLSTVAAAEAILRVANSRMAGAIRLVSIERGFDPKGFAFMPFGGGGALHTAALLRDVGIGRAIVPRYPGVTSAMGCVIADMRQDFVKTINASTRTLDTESLCDQMQQHFDAGMASLETAQLRFEAREIVVELDMAYAGQTHTVAVPLSVAVKECAVTAPTSAEIEVAFDRAYSASFSRLLKNGERRIINLRTAVIGKRPKFDLSTLAPVGGSIEAAKTSSRQVHFGDAWHETAIYDRLRLPVESKIQGPAILAQPDTTVLIDPGFAGRVDPFGNTIIEYSEA
ncbi:MAG: hydantoinase/oxoprolinase family protein [Aestuariivita sp.]|nr:hydantoinase/oxoprolinase family protein [Aestuariivita sp.]MCY4346656.1 hydantoinase/oxoprolinase family protein [Aestuariivita sp.]